MTIKKGQCVLTQVFGPLYVIGSFRDGPDALGQRWTTYEGINGKDGVSYQFEACDVVRKITREEFDSLPKYESPQS